MSGRVVVGLSAILLVSGCGIGGTSDRTVTVTRTVTQTATVTENRLSTDFVMPDVVGRHLQDAQDELQKLGSYVMDQQDASGQGRIQINDSNWKVCSQKPAAGDRVPIQTQVVLASVKLDETCPSAT